MGRIFYSRIRARPHFGVYVYRERDTLCLLPHVALSIARSAIKRARWHSTLHLIFCECWINCLLSVVQNFNPFKACPFIYLSSRIDVGRNDVTTLLTNFIRRRQRNSAGVPSRRVPVSRRHVRTKSQKFSPVRVCRKFRDGRYWNYYLLVLARGKWLLESDDDGNIESYLIAFIPFRFSFAKCIS